MRRLIALFSLALAGLMPAWADEGETSSSPDKVNVSIQARLDYQDAFGTDDSKFDGFKGKYLLLKVTGDLGEHWSYVYRQRPNKINTEPEFYNSIDFAHLTWRDGRHWSITAGKQCVAIGGYEYDAVPIDLYFASEFWDNVNCFLFGVGGTYKTTKGADSFTFQISESPFRDYKRKAIYGANFMWNGTHGCWSTIWSVNFFDQYRKGGTGYLSLGNRFLWGRNTLDVDLQASAGISADDFVFGKSFSIMTNWSHKFHEKIDAFAKYTYDHNTSNYADEYVLPHTHISTYGAGVEFYPYKRLIRLHLVGYYSSGANTNPAGVLIPGRFAISVGFTWKMQLFSVK